MITLDATGTYITTVITTVDKSHTIHLPDTVPNGATVAIIVMPPNWQSDKARQDRFAAALEELRTASISEPPTPPFSDQELNHLIRKLRKQMSSS